MDDSTNSLSLLSDELKQAAQQVRDAVLDYCKAVSDFSISEKSGHSRELLQVLDSVMIVRRSIFDNRVLNFDKVVDQFAEKLSSASGSDQIKPILVQTLRSISGFHAEQWTQTSKPGGLKPGSLCVVGEGKTRPVFGYDPDGDHRE